MVEVQRPRVLQNDDSGGLVYGLDDPSAIAITSQSWVADGKQWWQMKHDKNTIQPKAP